MSSLKIQSKFREYFVKSKNIKDIIEISNQSNIITIIDSNVNKLYPGFQNVISIECLENNKNLDSCISIYKKFIENNVKIDHTILTVGGGILQDIVGFCSSTFCRGIDYVFVPTTLLSQVDSCVGGKTSLNFESKKNILGTFYPPKEILICTEFLDSLTLLDKISGYGEVYKFAILQNTIANFSLDTNLEELIFNCLKYKSSILEIDEFDKLERKFLNFGHTFGHALESTSDYNIPHGIAVVIGSMIACNISKNMNFKVNKFETIMQTGKYLLNKSKIKLSKDWFDFNRLLTFIMSDKKNTKQGINMVLINDKPFLHNIQNIHFLKDIFTKTLCDYQII